MRRSIASSTLSLLDLLCCAFGGVIVLSVLYSAMITERAAVTQESYAYLEARIEQPEGVLWSARQKRAVKQFALGFRLEVPGMNDLLESHDKDMKDWRYSFSIRDHTVEGLPVSVLTIEGLPRGNYRAALILARHNDLELSTPVSITLMIRYPGGVQPGRVITAKTLTLEDLRLQGQWQEGTPYRELEDQLLNFSIEL